MYQYNRMNLVLIGVIAIVLAFLYYNKKHSGVSNVSNVPSQIDITKDPIYIKCTSLLQKHGLDINNTKGLAEWLLKEGDTKDKQEIGECLLELGEKTKQLITITDANKEDIIKLATEKYRIMVSDCKTLLETKSLVNTESIIEWLNKNTNDPDHDKIQKCESILSLSEAEIKKLVEDEINKFAQHGGSSTDIYYRKYLKYKAKYNSLKNN